MDEATVDALSWAVVADLAAQAGPDYRIVEMHPAGGTYNVLSLRGRSEGERPYVMLNRAGSISIHVRGQGHQVSDMGVWDRLATGEQSVVSASGEN